MPNWAEILATSRSPASPLKRPTPPDAVHVYEFERQQSLGRSVGLCINLCGGKAKAAETYDTAEWDQWDVAYKAIACADEAVPAEEAVDAFVAAVGSLWSDPLKRKLYVAVHCATGYNVTGYMICRYLMRVGAVERAVAAFAAARAPGIYDGELLAALAAVVGDADADARRARAAGADPAAAVKATAGKRKRAEAMPPPPPLKPAAARRARHRLVVGRGVEGGARRGEGGAQAGAGGGRAGRGGVRARAPPHAREDDGGAGVVKEAARLCGGARAGGGVHQAGEPAAKVNIHRSARAKICHAFSHRRAGSRP